MSKIINDKIKYHILNRRDIETSSRKRRKSGEAWTTETRIGSRPAGFKATEDAEKRGDIVYLNLSGYGVVAKGKIINRIPNTFNRIEEVLEYVRSKEAKDNSRLFWGEIIIDKCKTISKNKPLHVLELLSHFEVLPNLIRLDSKKFSNQWSYKTLEGPLEKEENYEEEKFNPLIPNHLKRDIQIISSLLSKDFVYDIDHFVPKSCGGPGNIIENLIPLNSSVNRGKRDSIPAGLFKEARKYSAIMNHANITKINSDYLSSDKKYEETQFFDDAKARDLAKIIIKIINSQEFDIEEAKSFYKNVRGFHFPRFNDLLEKNKHLISYQN